jgi:hypothetical protein
VVGIRSSSFARKRRHCRESGNALGLNIATHANLTHSIVITAKAGIKARQVEGCSRV